MILDRNGKPIKPVAKSAGGNKTNPKDIIGRITNGFVDRSRKDIQKWRNAIKLAEHKEKPNRKPLIDLYNDLKTDGHFKSQWRLRKSVILGKAFQIVYSNNEIDQECTEMISKKWFFDLLDQYIETMLYGHSLLDLVEIKDGIPIFKLVQRGHVDPKFKTVTPDLSKPNVKIQYGNGEYDDWIVEMGSDDLGFLNDIVPNLIWKRQVMQSWAEFCEKFGIPMITATTNRVNDSAFSDEISEMLLQLGEAAQAVFPEGTTIDIKEANRTDAFQTFDKFIERNDNEISKAITGGTMISDNGSSKSQSEVHERNLEKRLGTSDRRDLGFFFNEEFIPFLRKHGFKFSDDAKFQFDSAEEISIKEHWKIVDAMIGKKLAVDLEWASKRFNVPLTSFEFIDNGDESKKKVVMGRYSNIHDCGGHRIVAVSPNNQPLKDAEQKLIEAIFSESDLDPIKARLIAEEVRLLFGGLKVGYGDSIDVAWNQPDHLMLALMEQNLFDFATSKTEARIASISSNLIDPKTNKLRSFEDFKAIATKDIDVYSESYLRTEWNLSVAVGQNSASYLRAMEEINDFPYVQYMTAGDENVRSEHERLNGLVFSLRDKDSRSLVPPNGFGCRCELVQYPFTPNPSSVTKGKEGQSILGDSFKKSEFAINRAEIGNVFTKKQMYQSIKGIPKKLSSLNFKSFDLKNYNDMDDLVLSRVDKTISKENVKELFKETQKGSGIMQFTDYLKRKLHLTKSNFEKHTTGKYTEADELRHQIFPQAMEVLNNPDEVWLKEFGQRLQMRYISFFEDRVIVVDTEINKNNYGFEIKTWYSMNSSEENIRKGLLIRSKP